MVFTIDKNAYACYNCVTPKDGGVVYLWLQKND